MIPTLYLRLIGTGIIVVLLGLVCYKIYDAGAESVSLEWQASNAKVAQAVAADNADKAARKEEADRKFNAIDAANKTLLVQLNQYQVSTKQTESELKNAYSKLSSYRDANGLLWLQTSTRDTSTDQLPSIPVGTTGGGEVAGTTSPRQPNALELTLARETVLYNICIAKLEALYIQNKQPFYYETP